MNLSDFTRIVCINLDRREDRWALFQGRSAAAGLPAVERISGIDGTLIPAPPWFRAGNGAWGCYRSHMRILEDCASQQWDSYLVFEDDAIFCEDFQSRVAAYLAALPNDWEVAYLGGQHLKTQLQQPRRVNAEVSKPFNVNRTHGFAVRGHAAVKLYGLLTQWKEWERSFHIDHTLGRATESGVLNVYCPARWLVGQAEGVSDVNGTEKRESFWPSATAASAGSPSHSPFVAVVGLHSSGSSALAGALYHLGVYLGGKLSGYHGVAPIHGGEAVQLARICEDAYPFPSLQRREAKQITTTRLTNWIDNKRREAKGKRTIAGGKYPHFCLLGEELQAACGDMLRVIRINRPLEESILSLQKRCPNRAPEVLKTLQTHLDREASWVDRLPPSQVLNVDYSTLLAAPNVVIQSIIDWLAPLGFNPSPDQRKKAAEYINPAARHIDLTPSQEVLTPSEVVTSSLPASSSTP